MPGLTQGVPAQVFTPTRQQVISLTAGTPQTVTVPPERIVRYASTQPVKVTLGDTFDATRCFEAVDNLFGIARGIEAITLQAGSDATVYLEIG